MTVLSGSLTDHLHTKHFTLDHARRLLSNVVPLAEEMVRLKHFLDEQGYDIHRHQFFGGSGPNGDRFFPQELLRLVEIARTIEKEGILIKGLDEGLIDFPHIRSNGDEVYLCWKVGETDIRFWHGIPDGYAGRRTTDEL